MSLLEILRSKGSSFKLHQHPHLSYCIIILILSAHLVIITIALSVLVLFMLNNKNRRFQANFGNNCRWQGWRRQGSDSLEKMFLLNLICGGIHQDHQFNASAQQDVECTWLEPFWPAKLFYIIYNEGGSKTAAERIWNDKKNVNKRNHGPMNKTKGFEKPNTCSKTSYVV